MAHGARKNIWLDAILRALILLAFLVELIAIASWDVTDAASQYARSLTVVLAAATALILVLQIRQVISWAFTGLEMLSSGQLFVALVSKNSLAAPAWSKRRRMLAERFQKEKVLVPESMPHVVALWIYVTAACLLLAAVSTSGFDLPALPMPFEVLMDQLVAYNGLGLVLLAFCGVGIFVARKPREALKRLGWEKPSWPQAGLGVALIFFTFAFDYIWSLITHQTPGLANQVSRFNAGTFHAKGGGAGPSAFLALVTGLCAGVGEETLMRGALQPAFGILPAAFLHAVLHGQFSHAPVFIVQIFLWSAIMGIVRRYTNTTTTIIAHTGFNFITTFLFAFNP